MLKDDPNFKNIAILILAIFTLGSILTTYLKVMDFISYTYMMIYFFAFAIGGFMGIRILFNAKTPFNNIWRGILITSISLSMLSISIQDFSLIQARNSPFIHPNIATIPIIIIAVVLIFVGTLLLLSLYAKKINGKFLFEILVSLLISILIANVLIGENTYYSNIYIYINSILLTLFYIIFRISGHKIFDGFISFQIGLIFMIIGNIVINLRTGKNIHFIGDIGDFFIIISGLLLSLSIYLIGKRIILKI